MKNTTADRIIEILEKEREASAGRLLELLAVSRPVFYKHVARLIEEGKIEKRGRPPLVYYFLGQGKHQRLESDVQPVIDNDQAAVIGNNYLRITPDGRLEKGNIAFLNWCIEKGQDVAKAATSFVSIYESLEQYKDRGYIDATERMKKSLIDIFVDGMYYLDFYDMSQFGKTKMGTLVLYAKQAQDKALMAELFQLTEERIRAIVDTLNIGTIAFVPPTVKRAVQLMDYLEKRIDFSGRSLKIGKVSGRVLVPQKTLSGKEERIRNAATTFFIDTQPVQGNLLIVDDILGSGASINEIAKKIRSKQMSTGKIYGLVLAGSNDTTIFPVVREA